MPLPQIAHWYSRRLADESSLARYSPFNFMGTLHTSQSGAGKAAIRAWTYCGSGWATNMVVSCLKNSQRRPEFRTTPALEEQGRGYRVGALV